MTKYACVCSAGYTFLKNNGVNCTNPINNCAANNGGCGHVCIVTGPGLNSCACNTGYDLASNGTTCTPVNLCQSNIDICGSNSICQYSGPGTFSCSCLQGFVSLSGNGRGCQQILSPMTSSGFRTGIGAGIGISIGVLIIFLFSLYIRRQMRLVKHARASNVKLQELAPNIVKFERNDVEIGAELGRGEYGWVCIGTIRSSGELVAVKMLKSETEGAQSAFQQEADQLKSISHENVVRLIGTQFDSAPFLIVLEYLSNGDLKSYLDENRYLGQLNIMHLVKICSDVAGGFAYLQMHKFVHRDLAARNVLLSEKFVSKIGDFGMARQILSSEYYRQGSSSTSQTTNWALPLRWMAPESFTDGTWDLRTDVWMFGVLLWEIFAFGELPWKGLPDTRVIHNIQQRAKLEQPEDCPSEFYFDIMLSCWRLDPHSRISGAEISGRINQYIVDNMRTSELSNLSWPKILMPVSNGIVTTGVDLHGETAGIALQNLEIVRSSLSIGSILGEGAFGEVFKGTLTIDKVIRQVAVKSMKAGSSDKMKSKFADEARLFAMLKHPNIVQCIGLCLKSEPQLIILELLQGSLLDFVKKSSSKITRGQMVSAVSQIANAVSYLESRRIVHRDIAARNVLVGLNGVSSVKLNDFGMSRTVATSAYYRMVHRYAVSSSLVFFSMNNSK